MADASSSPLVLLVGHCGPDGHMLRNAVSRAVPAARIQMVDDRSSLDIAAPAANLLLINRTLDSELGGSGIELIRALKATLAADGAGPALMLVSNYPDAQAEAEAAGAVPGFGKREVYAEETARRIRTAVERSLSADWNRDR